MSDLFNVNQTAQLLGVHVNTVRNWVDKGLLQSIHLPGSKVRRFTAEEIERVQRLMRDDARHSITDGRRRRWPPKTIKGMSWYEPETKGHE